MATGTWKALLKGNAVDAALAARAFTKAIEASFVSHPMRHMTQAEVKRRFDICALIFEKLAGQHKWGLNRALDHVEPYLKAELNGVSWAPDSRACWLPQDG